MPQLDAAFFLVHIFLKEGIRREPQIAQTEVYLSKQREVDPIGVEVWVFVNICEVGSLLMQMIDFFPLQSHDDLNSLSVTFSQYLLENSTIQNIS